MIPMIKLILRLLFPDPQPVDMRAQQKYHDATLARARKALNTPAVREVRRLEEIARSKRSSA